MALTKEQIKQRKKEDELLRKKRRDVERSPSLPLPTDKIKEKFFEDIGAPIPETPLSKILKAAPTNFEDGAGRPATTGGDAEIFRNDKGQITAVLADGKFLPFGNDSEARRFLQRRLQKLTTPEGAIEVGEARQKEAILKATQKIGKLTPEQLVSVQGAAEAPIDVRQAVTAGLVPNAPSIISRTAAGATAGGVAGAIGGLGIGAIPAAIIGGSVGFISAVYSGIQKNIETQKKGEIGASQDVLSFGIRNMRQLAQLATQDPANADKYINQYNQQLLLIHRAREQIKVETDENLDKYIEDGTDIISDFNLVLDENGLADIYGQRLDVALRKGLVLTSEELPTLKDISGAG